MENNTVSKNLEQIQTPTLPRKAHKIIRSVVRETKRNQRTNESVLLKQIEFAYATLHMRLYQKFGAMSEDFIAAAYDELREQLGQAASSELPLSNLIQPSSPQV